MRNFLELKLLQMDSPLELIFVPKVLDSSRHRRVAKSLRQESNHARNFQRDYKEMAGLF